MNQETKDNTEIKNVPFKLKSDLATFMIFAMNHIRNESVLNNFEDFLGPNPPQYPPNLPNNARDKEKESRMNIQQKWKDKNLRFLRVLRNMTDGTDLAPIANEFFLAGDPIGALDAKREHIFNLASKTPKLVIDDFFRTCKLSDKDSLTFNHTKATGMIANATAALQALPINNGQYILSQQDKADYLRQLLAPLPSFKPVFSASQVTSTQYDQMRLQLTQAINSVNQNKAFEDTTAQQSRADHVNNEIDQAQPSTFPEHSQKFRRNFRSNQWRPSGPPWKNGDYQNSRSRRFDSREDYRRSRNFQHQDQGSALVSVANSLHFPRNSRKHVPETV
jgi:hypothetical protein